MIQFKDVLQKQLKCNDECCTRVLNMAGSHDNICLADFAAKHRFTCGANYTEIEKIQPMAACAYEYGGVAICSLGILTNLFVFITMVSSRSLRNYSAGKLIITLAVVDCLVNILGIPQFSLIQGTMKEPFCVWFEYFIVSFCHTSNLLVMFISINRYAIVCRPLKHHCLTSNKSIIIQIIGAIILSFLLNIHRFLDIDFDQICVITVLVIVIILPAVVTLILTLCIFSSLRQNRQILGDHSPQTVYASQLIKGLLSVLIKFLLLLLPIITIVLKRINLPVNFSNSTIIQTGNSETVTIINVTTGANGSRTTLSEEAITTRTSQSSNTDSEKDPFLTAELFIFLPYLANFTINYFLYLWYSPMFRASFIRLVTCGSCFKKNEESPNNLGMQDTETRNL